jgi:hypothetical protein
VNDAGVITPEIPIVDGDPKILEANDRFVLLCRILTDRVVRLPAPSETFWFMKNSTFT